MGSFLLQSNGGVVTEETSLIAGELDVAKLDDDQLLRKLKQFGIDAAIVGERFFA